MRQATASTSAPMSVSAFTVSRDDRPVVTMSSMMTTRAPFSSSKRRSRISPPSRSVHTAGTPRCRAVS